MSDVSWPDVARAQYTAYGRLLDGPVVPAHLAEQRARGLADLVPLLLEEISRRDMRLTAVRRLCGAADGLHDRGPDETVTVAELLTALDADISTDPRRNL